MVVVVTLPNVVLVAVPAVDENPSEPSADCVPDDEVEIEKLAALGVLIVMAPPSIDDVPPVIELIADNRLPTVPEVLMTVTPDVSTDPTRTVPNDTLAGETVTPGAVP